MRPVSNGEQIARPRNDRLGPHAHGLLLMPRYPTLYQVNTRVWLTALSRSLGRAATLDDAPDAELDSWASSGFDWIWLLGIWQTGAASRQVSLTHPALRDEYERVLPDWTEDDVAGSCFAIVAYRTHNALGGDAALARLRERLRERGLRLMLDFVPNHVALDHRWLVEHPEFLVPGAETDIAQRPQDFCRLRTPAGEKVFAHGRDPYFPGWSDTLQLDYSQPALQEAMCGELRSIAARCDGVRCDMAMLLLPDVFERTWGRRSAPFWHDAIQRVRQEHPHFCFLAEVYWDLEWKLQQQGFDYTYDKRLYDLLHAEHVRPVRDHLRAELDFQDRLARFIENHDEPRIAATFSHDRHKAAAVVTFLTPGMRFLHQGQLEGKRQRIPMQLRRGPDEPIDADLARFYSALLSILHEPAIRDGQWRLLACGPAWNGNPSHESFIAYAWELDAGPRFVVAVNYAPHPSQCYVRLPWSDLDGGAWRLSDRLGSTVFDREGSDLQTRGLYLDIPAWTSHVFEVTRLE